MIFTFIPYAPETNKKDLGWCYNHYMQLLPDDNDWACFLDHDAMFTTRNWYYQLIEITKMFDDVGCFTAMTNRIGNPMQVYSYKFDLLKDSYKARKKHFELLELHHSGHDIKLHRQIGQKLFDENYSEVIELDSKNLMSGVLVLVKKEVWKKIKFKSGFLRVDRSFHKDCLDQGYKVLLMKGVYVYHWYRGDGDISHVEEFF